MQMEIGPAAFFPGLLSSPQLLPANCWNSFFAFISTSHKFRQPFIHHSHLALLSLLQGEGTVETILTATDQLFNNMGDTPEMVRQARILAQATSELVNALKSQAESHPDSEMQKKLLAAAKMLADATARMVEAAKVQNCLALSFHQLLV